MTAKTIIAVVVTVLFCACGKPPEPPAPPPLRPVLYAEVHSQDGVRTRTFSGAAKAGAESSISFKVDGTLQALPLKIGDYVREGRLIGELDSTEYELRVEDLEASLAQAQAQAVRAKADLERIRGLYERSNASEADFDSAQAAADSSAANVESVKKKIEAARLQVQYCRLVSPSSGRVAEIPVGLNENVRRGQTIVTLTSGGLLEVEVAIPETLIPNIRLGQSARVRFDAFPSRQYGAQVREVAPVASEGLSTYAVTMRLSRTDGDVLPGMAAAATFEFGVADTRPRFCVEPHAVGEDRDGRFVFVVTSRGGDRGVVERRSVKVGELVSDGLEIFDGLSDGELVVVAGVARITDGQQVLLPGRP